MSGLFESNGTKPLCQMLTLKPTKSVKGAVCFKKYIERYAGREAVLLTYSPSPP